MTPIGQDNIGHGPKTEDKQCILRGLISMHVNMCRGIIGRQKIEWRRPYLFIDMNAAKGEGSASIFCEEIAKVKLPYQALFIELRRRNFNELASRFSENKAVEVKCGDHEKILPAYLQGIEGKPYGICYHDPNGVASWETLAAISKEPAFKYMDLLIHFTATGHKRAKNRHPGTLDVVMQYIKSIEKKYWIVRKPEIQWQWTFLIGSNWDEFPEWKKERFYKLESKEGKKIMERVVYTAKEQFELRQPRIPGFEEL